jgi:hypothetical protein
LICKRPIVSTDRNVSIAVDHAINRRRHFHFSSISSVINIIESIDLARSFQVATLQSSTSSSGSLHHLGPTVSTILYCSFNSSNLFDASLSLSLSFSLLLIEHQQSHKFRLQACPHKFGPPTHSSDVSKESTLGRLIDSRNSNHLSLKWLKQI